MNVTTLRVFASAFLTILPAAAATRVFEAFEGDGFGSWVETGTAFGKAPIPGITKGLTAELTAYSGESLACSAHEGDAALGSLTSAEFTIDEPYIVFLIAGGNQPGKTAAQLLVDGKVVKESTGKNSIRCETATWDVTDLKGKKAKLRLIDESTGQWGFIAADHFIFTNSVNQKFPPSTKGKKPYIKGLVATPVLPGVTIPEGVQAKVMADYKSSKLTSPTAMCFDEKGNIYVSETHRFRFGIMDDREHLYWYLDDLAAMKVEDRRKLHEKWKEKVSIKSLTEKSEKIRLLVDKDGDGVCETTTIFAEGFNDVLDGTAAGVFALEGTIYLASIPKIWALRDQNGDGVSDEKKVIQDGFGVRISLSGHDLNGFALGPDGMIYGTVGDRALHFTTKEGKEYNYPNEGAAFRFDPDGSNFEIIHTGLRNPKEIAFDKWGNAISVDNNSDQGDKARVVYIVPGGESGWQMENQAMHTFYEQIGLDKHPINRWMAERMWEPQNDAQPAYILPPMANLTSGPSGLTYHPGAGFLESEVGRFLICDYRGASANSGIFSFAVAADGAGMKLVDAREFNWGVAATDAEYSYDGKLMVLDFKGGWTSHEDGRLYSLDAGDKMYKADSALETKKLMAEGFGKRTKEELGQLLKHADMRVRLRAQIELTRSADGFGVLASAIKSNDEIERLHGIWGMGIIARRGIVARSSGDGFAAVPNLAKVKDAAKILVNLLSSKDAEVRAQSLKMLADVRKLPMEDIPVLLLLADESARVKFFALNFLAKQKVPDFAAQIVEILEQNNNKDPFLRIACAHALASTLTEQQFVALQALPNPAARLGVVVALRRIKSALLENYVADADPRVADEAIRAIHDQMLEASRPAVAALLDQRDGVKRTEMMWRRLLQSAFRLGGDENAARLLATASDAHLDDAVREEATRLLSTWTKPFPVDQSIGRWAPLAARDPEPLKKILTAGLPALIKSGGSVLVQGLGLVDQYQLKLEGLAAVDLHAIVENKDLLPSARVKAMALYAQTKSSDAAASYERWSKDAEPSVALAALAEIVSTNPAKALAPLKAALQKDDTSLQQGAWLLLGKIPGEGAATTLIVAIKDLAEKKGALPYAIELLEAAKSRPEPALKEALAAWEKSLPADDALAPWAIALEGGDAKRGEQIYLSHPAECMRCHRAGEGHAAGGEAGPNLGGVGKRGDHRYLMESLMVPGATVASGFGVVSITLSNGKSTGGILLSETPEHVDIDMGEKISRVKRADIKEMTPPISAMPPMSALLKPREARDLVAWLSSLDKAVPAKKSGKKIEPLLISFANQKSELMLVSTASADDAAPPVSAESTSSEADLKAGKAQFALCQACHGPDGGGVPNVGPPLAKSEWVNGAPENLIRIQLRGLQGPIKVKGSEYSLVMPPQAFQTDEQIASVLTYVRNSFGNQASSVTPDQVKALRGEVGKPMLSASELIAPKIPVKAVTPAVGITDEVKKGSTARSLSTTIGLPLWGAALVVIWIGVCLVIGWKKQD